MARIPAVTRDTVPTDQQAIYDEIVRQRGSPPVDGPLSVMANVPEILRLGEQLRGYLRGDASTLSAKIRELAMLVTARELDCQFIWNAYAAQGRSAGLSDDVVDNLRDNIPLPNLSSEESAVVNYGREFFRTHRVSQAVFDAAHTQFGARGLTELTNLMGYYALLAFNVNAFGVELPPETTEKPLPV